MQVFNSAHHSFTYGSPNSDIGTKSTSSRIGKEGKKNPCFARQYPETTGQHRKAKARK